MNNKKEAQKIFYQRHREEILQKNKEYYIRNKDILKQKRDNDKKYRMMNNEAQLRFYQRHKEEIKQNKKDYYNENKDKIKKHRQDEKYKKYFQDYRKNHREYFRQKSIEQYMQRKKPTYISCNYPKPSLLVSFN